MEVVLLLVMCLNHNLFWWCNQMTFICFGDEIGGEQVWWLSINLQSNKVTVIGQFLRSAQKQSLYYFANWLTITKLILLQLPHRNGEKVLHPMTSPIKRNPVTSPKKHIIQWHHFGDLTCIRLSQSYFWDTYLMIPSSINITKHQSFR